ncbi:hypothetical protein Acr_24g0007000 [Actinidia rufa]|uniref:Uncharacterized protein n=1 Tax=Actinidia rufa TaxID=165716 RepID=A0A7J0GUJ5_9ERIC|nr:hypothetical protein Acr_24g0007000 [Actinidia rufa]
MTGSVMTADHHIFAANHRQHDGNMTGSVGKQDFTLPDGEKAVKRESNSSSPIHSHRRSSCSCCHKANRKGLNGVSSATGMVRMDSRGDGDLKGTGHEWIRWLAVEISDNFRNGIVLHVWVPATDRQHGKCRGTPEGEGNTLVVVGGRVEWCLSGDENGTNDSQGDGDLKKIRWLAVEIFGGSQNGIGLHVKEGMVWLAVEVSSGSQIGIGLHVWVLATDRRHGKYRGTPKGEGNTLVAVGGDLVVAGGSVVATREEREREKGLGVPEAGGEVWRVERGDRGLISPENGSEDWPEMKAPLSLSVSCSLSGVSLSSL